ncbi:MAG: CsoS2 family carboxysome shell protein [Pseudomonadota bacterium]
MTQAADSTASATLSGRELALKRRQAMALHGKTGVTRPAAGRQPTAARSAPVAPAASPIPAAAGSMPAATTSAPRLDAALLAQVPANASRQASRARREALSRAGKAALTPTAARPTGRVRPNRQAPAVALQSAVASAGEAQAAPATSCGCGCNGEPGGCGDTQASATGLRAASDVTTPVMIAKTSGRPTGRALAQARRAALAQDGKAGLKRVAQATKIAAALPGQDWQAAIAKGATGRQVAMQRRLVQALAGRTGASEPARPSGRQRARNVVPAPPKVEEGHTLSGQTVTGTLVERSKKVTGNEPGSCRAITGTEYIGSEQFESLCNTRPAPAPAKVGVSSTAREHKVTGTEVGRSGKVTGDEPGACRGVTGTEYLAVERYEEFCNTRPAPSPAKVGVSDTAKGKVVTGTQVGHSQKVTGDEPGADRAITGTGYTLPAAGVDAPEKVVVTHTTHGKPVTGTAVGHTVKITGDEPGACRGITGTEYLAAEQFQTVCNTAPPATPRKVSVMSSRGDLPVSGTGVGRSASVTGDEAGSCRAITGSQYYTASDFGGLCNATGPRKVGAAQTLAGRTVTGTEVGASPKLTGDEMGGCKPVTGIDYVGAQAACTGSTPVAPVAKVAVDQTWRGQPVTGSYVGRSSKVTGDESGGCAPISGTPYIGRSQYSGFCAAPDLTEQEARIRTSAIIPATAVTGDRPGAGGSVMTGDERGACEVVSGTPYVGADNTVGQCATSGRFVSRPRTWVEPVQPPAPMDFSIASPARQAWERRYADVTGTGYNSERITGPVNKADGLITGTPEFRHRDAASLQAEQQAAIAAARRLTGEGSQAGRPITGDAWHAQSRVTGTEGASSLARNMSMRGNPRGAGANAQVFREVERPDVPESRITGSSGNTGKGAVVTLSGGARG